MSTAIIDPVTGVPHTIDGMRSEAEIKELMLEFCYPIGSIYVSTDNTSPATFLGGTWIQLDGYMLRAADGTTNVVTPNQNQNDGGADLQTVSSVASHNHTQNSHNHTQNSHNHSQNGHSHTLSQQNTGSAPTVGNGSARFAGGTTNWAAAGSVYGVNVGSTTASNNATTATNQANTATNIANGANYTVPTLPKYKNVYMWERTA